MIFINWCHFQYSAIATELPPNIYLMSFEPWKDKSFLIRFEHIMEIDEDTQQSLPVSFNVSHIFPGNFTFREVSLGANQWIENVKRFHFKEEGSVKVADKQVNNEPMQRQTNDPQLIITMNPMEIRTFIMSPIADISSGTKSQTTFGFIIILVLLNCLIATII